MKKIKRILMMLAICSLSVVAFGCSSEEKKTTNETTEKKENKETKKLSNEEVIKKFMEASNTIKSSKSKIDYKISMSAGNDKVETSMNMDIESTDKPMIAKMTGSMNVMGQKVDTDMYITEEAIYSKNPITKEWLKIVDEEMKKSMEAQKDAGSLEKILSVMNSAGNNLKIEEKDSDYVISYSGLDESVKKAFMEVIVSNDPSLKTFAEGVTIEKLEVYYKADKNTFLPKEYGMKMAIKVSEDGVEGKGEMELNGTMSDINKVEPIKIPDEVKNAKEYKGN